LSTQINKGSTITTTAVAANDDVHDQVDNNNGVALTAQSYSQI
jgi:hypothetical protein